MKKSNASMSEWPAIAVGLPLAAVAAWAGISSAVHGDQRQLTARETYERDYEFCMHGTGYELTQPVWEDASHKRQIDTIYIGTLVVTNDNVTVIPGGKDQERPSLNFDFTTIDGVRHLEPADTYTKATAAHQEC
jgi:hypothetical protein